MRNITELIEFCENYINKYNTISGINVKLTNEEINSLKNYYGATSLSEICFIIRFKYVNICKICQKKTKFKSAAKGYNIFCCHKCSTLDTEANKSRVKKGIETKKKNNYPIIHKTSIILCIECNIEVVVKKKKIHLGYCNEHKKSCTVCSSRHNNSGVCCSHICVLKMKEKTNLKNSGVKHNLMVKGTRPNQIEFYLKKGHSLEEANKILSEYQSNIIKTYTENPDNVETIVLYNYKLNNISEYYLLLVDKIKKFEYKGFYKPYELITQLCSKPLLTHMSLKKIYNILYKIDNDIFKYERIAFKKTKYGIVSYTDDGIFLRSMLEYYFYHLLKSNGIKKFDVDKKYPNSRYRYDFYLEDYEIYVEIAGIKSDIKYTNKMQLKKQLFKNVEILITKSDMLEFIQKLKTYKKYENI